MPHQVIVIPVEYEHAAQVSDIIREALMKAHMQGLFNGRQPWGPIEIRRPM